MANTPSYTKAEVNALLSRTSLSGVPKPNFVKITEEELYISTKYDSNNDWQCRFKKCMANNLYTFQRIGLVQNQSTVLEKTKVDAVPETILMDIGSDNISPIRVNGSTIGGNHFVDGYRTANSNWFDIYIDGNKIEGAFEGFADEIMVVTNNTLFNPVDLPGEVPVIDETVAYYIKGSSIDVTNHHRYLLDVDIHHWYGMSSVKISPLNKMYFGQSQYDDLIDYGDSLAVNAGTIDNFPNVDKIVLCNDDKTICQSMIMNRSRGLGALISENVDSGEALAFKATTDKVYFKLIYANRLYSAGESNFWNGNYTWFNQQEAHEIESNTVFAYPSIREKEKIWNVDFKGAETQQILESEKIGEGIAVMEKSDSVESEDFMTAAGVKITASGSGAIKIK